MNVIREDIAEAGRKLRNALSALDSPTLAASGERVLKEYADLELRLRSALAWTEAAYHEARRLK